MIIRKFSHQIQINLTSKLQNIKLIVFFQCTFKEHCTTGHGTKPNQQQHIIPRHMRQAVRHSLHTHTTIKMLHDLFNLEHKKKHSECCDSVALWNMEHMEWSTFLLMLLILFLLLLFLFFCLCNTNSNIGGACLPYFRKKERFVPRNLALKIIREC